MTGLDRRIFALGGLSALSAAASSSRATARGVTDAAGRGLMLPDRITRVMAAGPPASAALYCLAPEALIGWEKAPRAEEKPFLLPSTRELPEVGRLTGRGDTANVEVVLAAEPDLIVDFGSVLPTYVSLADATQQRTGIPYALIDGRFAATVPSLRLLGSILGVPARGEALAMYADDVLKRVDAAHVGILEPERPGVYLARGPQGLETGLKGSINTEIIERAGGRNVADAQGQRRGIANVSPEQLLAWNPEVIITWDRRFFQMVTTKPDEVWKSVRAVADKRVHLAPTVPFGWIDGPPSVNRLIGLAWLANIFNGSRFPFDIAAETKAFYKLFYQVDVGDADLAALVAWADGRPPGSAPRQ